LDESVQLADRFFRGEEISMSAIASRFDSLPECAGKDPQTRACERAIEWAARAIQSLFDAVTTVSETSSPDAPIQGSLNLFDWYSEFYFKASEDCLMP
jgi:hypothetical protein